MKQGWEVKRLGELITLNYGKALDKSERSDSGSVPAYGANGIKDYTERSEYKGPTLIVGRKGSAGAITRVDGPFWPLDVTYYVSFNDNLINFSYLEYLLTSLNLPSLAKGVKPGINRNDVYGISVYLPPLEEQKRIVAVLDEAFAGLETARTNAEANLKNAEELFVSTLDNLFSLRANKCEYVPLERHVEFVDYRGKTPTKSTSGIRLITAKNVKMGKINMEPREFMPHDLYDGWMTRGIPEEGDVLFTTEAPLANVAQLDTNEPVVIGQRLITMKPDNSVLLSNYLKFVLMSPAVQKDIRNNGTGATVVGIKASLLKKIKIPLASSIEEQRKLGAKAEESFSGLEQLRTDFAFKVTELSNLRQSLLQKAFAGELT